MTDELLDQGVTRLQLLAFLSGDESDVWNSGDTAWVRYRAHQIDRINNPDGLWVQLAFVNHTGFGTGSHDWRAVNPVAVLRDIDTIIDAAIAHHGADGVA